MLHLPEVLFRKMRNFFSRSKWLVYLLNLSRIADKKEQRGLIMIQIDALSRQQLEKALKTDRMPFLKHLLQKQQYRLQTHYSGMPCCTPAVQGELFYGVQACVPSFSFYRRQQQRIYTFLNPPDAAAIESELQQKGSGLFKNGSCYSNIFTGGAKESHFCISDIHLSSIFKRPRTFGFLIGVVLHLYSLVRAAALLMLEFFLAIIDFFRGLIAGRNLWKEIKFIPSRVGMCILLREILVIGAKLDITRGLPIIHLNFMGYHEQSHRRGSTSRLALWTLKGIDDAIKRVWKKAHRSDKEYEIWIYSDHGQVDTYPYEFYFKTSVDNIVKLALNYAKNANQTIRPKKRPGFMNRLGMKLQEIIQTVSDTNKDILVTSLGPLAQVYLSDSLPNKKKCAKKLLQTGKIPLILLPEENRTLRVMTRDTEYVLPDQVEQFRFDNQFVPEEWMQDLINLAHHPDAGDLLISGYQGPKLPYLTFVIENGSHGGISEQEYTGFLIAPNHYAVNTHKEYVRPIDIRNRAMEVIRRSDKSNDTPGILKTTPKVFRIMTYNTHSCIGMDGRLSILRIARVIEQFNPDIVALQELDVGRKRTKHEDQATAIAEILKMDHSFFPAIATEQEQYGDAILSRFPMRHIKSSILPGHTNRQGHEPRGALWVEVHLGETTINIINTHLGLRINERQQQIESLLGTQWAGHDVFNKGGILCGDLNFSPLSKLHRQCCQLFEASVPRSKPAGTYCGHRALIRLDHIFYKNISLKTCKIGDTELARIASDHRPLIAEFRL